MNGQDICVVAPTIRNPDFVREYAENAREYGHLDRVHVVLVTEDFCDVDAMRAMLDEEGLSGRVFDGSARETWFRDRGLTEYAELVPKKSHAQTSFGLLYLWAGEFEYGVFLDDDTRPAGGDFFGGHLRNLHLDGEAAVRGSDERWVNVLEDADADLYPRGYPYGAMDETTEYGRTHLDGGEVAVSQGLWTGVPDLDAARILATGDLRGQSDVRLTPTDYPEEGYLTAAGDYLTICSMNLAFRREVVPAFYQLPMDDNPWGVGRFDDIWSGVLVKRACDVLGTRVYSGGPLCVHEKAPRSTFGDLRAEAPALELNESLWRFVDDAGADAEGYAEAYAAMADALRAADPDAGNADFLGYVAEDMDRWLSCLDALDRKRAAPADD